MVEFFTSGSEVMVQDKDGVKVLGEDSPYIPSLLERIRDLYPEAYKAMEKVYAKSRLNQKYFAFLVVRRFCKCNFGSLDHTFLDIEGERFNFEVVPCPLRGECLHEGVICQPKVETRLSEAEMRVMRLVCEGLSNVEIAEQLYLSLNTVKRHISTVFIKTNTKSRTEFIKKYTNLI